MNEIYVNTTRVKGIELRKNASTKLIWRASITVNKKKLSLGSFAEKDQAIKARQDADIQYFNLIMHFNKIKLITTQLM